MKTSFPRIRRSLALCSVQEIKMPQPSGKLDAARWIQEGDGLRSSARIIRGSWVLERRALRKSALRSPTPTVTPNWSKLVGSPRASILLLGYSVEMYLKAALAKAYKNCRPEMFSRDSQRFSHDYDRLSTAVDFPHQDGDHELLKALEEFVTDTSRYPLFPDSENEMDKPGRFEKMNAVAKVIWDSDHFKLADRLARRVRRHAAMIDADSKNSASLTGPITFGTDGYICARSGGHLADRITFKFSKEMVSAKKNIDAVKELVDSLPHHSLLPRIWDCARIIQDDLKKSAVIRGPDEIVPATR